MSSGVAVHADVPTTFKRIIEGKKDLRYVIFKIEDKQVVVEKAVASDDSSVAGGDYSENSKGAFESFVADLEKSTQGWKDCRYAVFDVHFMCSRAGAGTSKLEKVCFFQICPDGAAVKSKMIYASSAATIKAALGSDKFIPFQITEVADLSHADLLNTLVNKFNM